MVETTITSPLVVAVLCKAMEEVLLVLEPPRDKATCLLLINAFDDGIDGWANAAVGDGSDRAATMARAAVVSFMVVVVRNERMMEDMRAKQKANQEVSNTYFT